MLALSIRHLIASRLFITDSKTSAPATPTLSRMPTTTASDIHADVTARSNEITTINTDTTETRQRHISTSGTAVEETGMKDNTTTVETATETSTTSVDQKQVGNSSASAAPGETVTTTSGTMQLPADTSTVMPVIPAQQTTPDSRVRGTILRQHVSGMHFALIRSHRTVLSPT